MPSLQQQRQLFSFSLQICHTKYFSYLDHYLYEGGVTEVFFPALMSLVMKEPVQAKRRDCFELPTIANHCQPLPTIANHCQLLPTPCHFISRPKLANDFAPNSNSGSVLGVKMIICSNKDLFSSPFAAPHPSCCLAWQRG